jgi:hypothetical protein
MHNVITSPPNANVKLMAVRIIENIATLNPEHRSDIANANLAVPITGCLA